MNPVEFLEQTKIIPFDQNGHHIHSWPSRQYVTADIAEIRTVLVPFGNYHGPLLRSLLSIYHECRYCGERPDLILGDDNVVRAVTSCPSVDGITTVIELHVPSGKIVVDDDLRRYGFDVDKRIDDLLHDYNTAIGQGEYVVEMAKIGCAYGPVGNSSPSLYRTGEGTYVIVTTPWDEGADEPQFDGELLASICTDLWAYSIVDLDDFIAHGGSAQDVEDNWTMTIVDVEPGTYRFTHHTGERSFDRDDYSEPIIYAHIEKVN